MMFMNEDDIAEVVQRFRAHPVLGPAARFLDAFKDQVNQHSDGWPYWRPPVRAARQLIELLEAHRMGGMGAYPVPPAATAAQVRKAITPIKAFMTRHGYAVGMRLPHGD